MRLFIPMLLAISLLVRGVGISISPPEMFGDEVDVGYQSLSLLKTGRDLYGQLLPTYIHSLAEWRTPLLMYYTVPFIAIFGNTDWGVRGPEVVLGGLAPIILLLLVYQLSRSRLLALISGLMLAVMPWHILYSRAAFEAVLLLNFVMLGTLLFLKKRIALSLLFFFLTPYIYSTASVFVPLWLGVLCVYCKPKLQLSHGLAFIILTPFIISIFNGHAAERFGKVGLFASSEITDAISEYRARAHTPWERFFSNRPVFITNRIFTNYLSAFSPEFLFIRGDGTARHSLQYIGQLFPVWAPLLVLGLIYLIRTRRYIWLVWLVAAPIPAALTYDGTYHSTRLFMLIPPLAVSTAAGLIYFVSLFPRGLKKWIYMSVWLVISVQFIMAANYYFFHYPIVTWRWWHIGFRETMHEVARLAPDYSKVFINNTYEPALIRFLFYTNYAPELFHKNFTIDKPSNVTPGYYGFYLAPKYYFGGFSPPANKSLIDVIEPGNLYVVSQRDDVPGDWDWQKNPPGGIKVLFTARNPSGMPIFYIVTKT